MATFCSSPPVAVQCHSEAKSEPNCRNGATEDRQHLQSNDGGFILEDGADSLEPSEKSGSSSF